MPESSSGECSESQPCPVRGEECNLSTRQCEPIDANTDSLDEDFVGGSFAVMPIPFFRGRVCYPTAVATGDSIPVKISPCMHPCTTTESFKFNQKFTCEGADCDIIVVQWLNASGDNCPADAFERFNEGSCQYPVEVNANVGPITPNGNPVAGEMFIELPFLTNADAAEFANGVNTQRAFEIVGQYPSEEDRRLPISIQPNNESAPANCMDESQCTCVDVGF